MKELIKVAKKNLLLLNKDLLGTQKAQLWVGKGKAAEDDDDERVARERKEAKEKKEIYGIEAQEIALSNKNPGWFEVSVSAWPAGKYRFMLHGFSGEKTPRGRGLGKSRDIEYSWPNIDDIIENLSQEQKNFLYLEKNNRGFCFRVEIDEKREIHPAGNGNDWIDNWSEIRKKVEKHLKEKEEKI